MARLKPISQQFDIAIKGTMEEVHKAIVATAAREHGKIMKAEPRPASFTRTVDGIRGAPLEQVKRIVVFEYHRLAEVAQFAMETLFARSPVKSGDYRRSHTLFLNGVAVANLKGYKPGDRMAIANSVPYSRKIEAGKMKMRVSGTDHVYQQAEQIVRRRYGNIANVRFTYQGIVGGARATGKAAGRSGGRYPALIITER